MPVAIAKAVDLVLDRRAIARALCRNRASEQRRPIKPGANDVMRPLVGPRNAAKHLRQYPPRRQRRHRPAIGITRLFGQARPVDRATIESWRSPGLEPRHRQPGAAQLRRQAMRSPFADAAAFHALFATKQPSTQERASAQNHRSRLDCRPVGKIHTADPVTGKPQ